jgi:hypothetical protein
MGLMDKVKAQATQLAQQGKEAAEQGKAKLDQAQASRRGDAMVRQLGAIVLAERTGRGTPDSQAKIDQLINDISAFERENGVNLTRDSASQASVPPQGQSGSTFQGGGQSPDAGGSSFPNQSFFPSPDSDTQPGGNPPQG